MTARARRLCVPLLIALLGALTGCGDPVRCGEGTVLVAGTCVVATDGAGADATDSVATDVAPGDAPSPLDATDVPSAVDARADVPLDAALDGGFDAARADAPAADAAATDAGPLEIRADDTLLVAPAMPTLLPGHLVCPTYTLLRADGTRVPVLAGAASAAVTPNDPSALAAADAGDCGPLGGYLALASRATTVRLTLTSGGASVSVVVPVTIADGHIELSASNDLVLPVGGASDYQLIARYLLTAGGTVSVASQARFVPRYFTGLGSSPAGLFDVTTPDASPTLLSLRGGSTGTGHVAGAYGPPGHAADILAAGTITVVAPGTLTSVGPTFFYRDGAFVSQGAPQSMAPGDCLEMRVHATFTASGGATYQQVLDPAGVTFTVSGEARLEAGPPPRICATARGEAVVRACAMGVCGSETIPVLVPGEAVTLGVAPSSVTITQAILGAISACVPLRATVRYADGTTRDVTNSRATQWFVPLLPGSPAVIFFRATSGDTLRVDAMGNPCFTGSGPATRTYDATLNTYWGGLNGTPAVTLHIQ